MSTCPFTEYGQLGMKLTQYETALHTVHVYMYMHILIIPTCTSISTTYLLEMSLFFSHHYFQFVFQDLPSLEQGPYKLIAN